MEFENQVILGSCLDVLRKIPDDTFDSTVTDVPYGLGNREPTPEEILAYLQGADLDVGGDFMGRDWEIPSVLVWKEIYRVMKPGAHLFSFGGTRTWDLISMGIRMAGFEKLPSIASNHAALQWLQSQGMPKSWNVSKAIDSKLGVEREVIGHVGNPDPQVVDRVALDYGGSTGKGKNGLKDGWDLTKAGSAEAEEWEGWGTGLKPTWEPILVFMKPIAEKTIAENFLKHGTGGMNIDATRVKHVSKEDFEEHKRQVEQVKAKGGVRNNSWKNSSDLSGANDVNINGRWPPDVVFTHAPGCEQIGTRKEPAPVINRFTDGAKPFGGGAGHPYETVQTGDENGEEEVIVWQCVPGCPVQELDRQSGNKVGCGSKTRRRANADAYKRSEGQSTNFAKKQGVLYPGKGGASKIFPQFEAVEVPFFYTGKASKKEVTLDGEIENDHPTKKPLALMRWLVRLATRKGGLVLDPYCGSGSTLHAAYEERMRFTGIERGVHEHGIAARRMAIVMELVGQKQQIQDNFARAMELSDE